MLTAEHIERRGISDPEVLRAMRAVPRHEFVPQDMVESAYEDRPLDIGYGATISQPYIVAAMSQLLALNKSHRVLEIGTGSGYQSAILAELAHEVYSVEVVPELAESAAATLRRLGYRNVMTRYGDGYLGWPDQAPFDRIILTAAPLELPKSLTDQLAYGGLLIAPVGDQPNQQLIEVAKSAQGQLRRRVVFPVSFVPMVSASS
jgi:protein-L-isoaspartate(D-aspartate) O-methyltransferase